MSKDEISKPPHPANLFFWFFTAVWNPVIWRLKLRHRFDAWKTSVKMIDPAPIKYGSPSLKHLIVLLTGITVGLLLRTAAADVSKSVQEDVSAPAVRPAPSEKTEVHLYFAGRTNSFLKSEQRVMDRSADQTKFGRDIVRALIQGPQSKLIRTIPEGTQLRAFYIAPDNMCYVDLSGAVRKNHPGGSNSEMLTIYSIVNSLILNLADIERVKILIDGRESPTLAGHITLQQPFKAHMLIIR